MLEYDGPVKIKSKVTAEQLDRWNRYWFIKHLFGPNPLIDWLRKRGRITHIEAVTE